MRTEQIEQLADKIRYYWECFPRYAKQTPEVQKLSAILAEDKERYFQVLLDDELDNETRLKKARKILIQTAKKFFQTNSKN